MLKRVAGAAMQLGSLQMARGLDTLGCWGKLVDIPVGNWPGIGVVLDVSKLMKSAWAEFATSG